MLNVAGTARFLLRMREPFVHKLPYVRQRIGYFLVRGATPYIYSRASPGMHLTDAERRDNRVATNTFKAVCKLWCRNLTFGH